MILKTVKYTDIKSTAIKEIDINGKSIMLQQENGFYVYRFGG